MAVTQKEIARRLNLSQSTVAKVLNNRDDVWVSKANRERIQDMVKELNYRPNPAARALRDGKSMAVTFYYTTPDSWSMQQEYSTVIEVCAERLGELGYELKVKVFNTQDAILEALKSLTSMRDTDVVILWGDEALVEDQSNILAEAQIPFVVKGRFELSHPNWLQFDFDHEYMMVSTVDYLWERGHRRIAYLGLDDPAIFSKRLFAGYEKAIQAHGLAVESDLVTLIKWDSANAEAAVSRWIALPDGERPTALALGSGGAMWQGIERALARAGRRVGYEADDFCVAGDGTIGSPLSFGHAAGFKQYAFQTLAKTMFEKLLAPALTASLPSQRVVRIRPSLEPIDSLDWLEIADFKAAGRK